MTDRSILVSKRFVPIREAVCRTLTTAPELAEVKAVLRDREILARLPGTGLPALGVFFATSAGKGRSDQPYRIEVHVVVGVVERWASEDRLFAYIEAVENALRAVPTLGGLIRTMSVGLTSLHYMNVESYWRSHAVLLLTCERLKSSP